MYQQEPSTSNGKLTVGETLALVAILPALACEMVLAIMLANWLSIVLGIHSVYVGIITWKIVNKQLSQ